MLLESGNGAALVACSNGQPDWYREQNEELCRVLRSMGLTVRISPYLYAQDTVFGADAVTRAGELMECYQNPDIQVIFDVSGGDLANEILDLLDYDIISKNPKPLFGYSDLTCLLNAVHTRTGQTGYLYQVKNLVYEDSKGQRERFWRSLFAGQEDLFSAEYRFLQGKELSGEVVGGNARCLLKLAGTPFWPDLQGKLLFLEAYGGGAAQVTDYLSHYRQLGVFRQVRGILLGSFTELEESGERPGIEELVLRFAGSLPVAKTRQIGHGPESRCLRIGMPLSLNHQNA